MTTHPREATTATARSALAYFQSSDWSEDLESSLNSFRSLRAVDNDEDSDGVGAETSSDPANVGTSNHDAANADDEGDDDELSEGDALRVPDEFICPLTLTVMRDPVVSKFGHSYERDAILSWLVEHRQTCPLTRKPLSLGGIITNHQLRGQIRKWQLEHEMDVTVLCSASEFDRASMASSSFSFSKLSQSSSLARLGGFYIVPDLDDTERSTDDEADDDAGNDALASARRRLSRLQQAGEGSSAAARPSTGRRNGTASRRSSTTGVGGTGNLRLVSGISRRFFGSRPAAA
jgi:U-box domain